MIPFYGEALLAPRPAPKPEDHPLSATRHALFNIFAATLHTAGRSSIRNPWTRHAVVTGTIPEDQGPQLHRGWYNVLPLGRDPMNGVSDTSTSSCELYGQPVDTKRLAKARLYADQPVSQVLCDK